MVLEPYGIATSSDRARVHTPGKGPPQKRLYGGLCFAPAMRLLIYMELLRLGPKMELLRPEMEPLRLAGSVWLAPFGKSYGRGGS
jgi:hypothetical protein